MSTIDKVLIAYSRFNRMALSTSHIGAVEIPDRWEREIALQKTFGLSPSEAKLMVARDDGLTIDEIADLEGLSVQTVKNTLSNARKRMQGENDMEFYISRVYQNQSDNSMAKANLSQVLAYLCRCMGYNVNIMKHTIVIKGFRRDQPGDPQWFKANVERYVDMVGTRSDTGAQERAERIKGIYDNRIEGESKFGHAVLKYYLDHYYINYDINEVEQ